MYNSNDVADRIRAVAKEKGIIVSKMLSDCQLAKNTLINFKTSMPKADNLSKIAEYLDVSVDYLLGTTDIPDRLGKNLRAVETAPQTMLPVYGLVSAGRGLFADNEIIGYESADCKYGNGEYIWVEVSGDSMSPDISVIRTLSSALKFILFSSSILLMSDLILSKLSAPKSSITYSIQTY